MLWATQINLVCQYIYIYVYMGRHPAILRRPWNRVGVRWFVPHLRHESRRILYGYALEKLITEFQPEEKEPVAKWAMEQNAHILIVPERSALNVDLFDCLIWKNYLFKRNRTCNGAFCVIYWWLEWFYKIHCMLLYIWTYFGNSPLKRFLLNRFRKWRGWNTCFLYC